MATEPEGLPKLGQRGYVAVLFTDLCDYTQLSEGLDPEDVALIKSQLQDLATPIIAAHSGELIQSYGDGILAVFGFPDACEDSARRAVDAALALHDAVRRAAWGCELPGEPCLHLHSGIHSGVVFARQGSVLSGRYDLSGDAMNTAARLCAFAKRDEIIVSSAAISGIEAFFSVEGPFGVELKGKRERLSVMRISGRSGARTRFEAGTRRGLTSFVGRDAELAQLEALHDSKQHGWGRLAIVVGAAGVGKTRLLEEFRARQCRADVNVLFGSCDNYTELAPLAPFVQIMRQAFGLRAALAPPEAAELLDQCLSALGPSLQAHSTTFKGLLSLAAWTSTSEADGKIDANVVAALTELLHKLSSERALTVMLDDWQWADDASRGLLLALLQAASEHGDLSIVVGMRSLDRVEESLRPQLLLELQPFDEEESQLVIRHLLPYDGGTEFVRSLFHLSGGNALFLEELCRSLPETFRRGIVPELTEIPATLQGVIHTRVARLPQAQAEVLRVAAVVGLVFSLPVLTEISGRENVTEALQALSQEDLIYATGDHDTYRFKHGVARDVIYETVMLAERRRMHGAVARLIAETVAANSNADQSESLAYHYAGSGDHARAAMYSELAGAKAIQQSSFDRARFHYAAGLAALEKLPQTREIEQRWIELSMRWAEPCAYSPRRANVRVMERAAQLGSELNDVAAQCRAGHWIGWFYFVLGDYANSITAYRKALDLASASNDQRMVAQLWSNLGQVYGAAGEYSEALPLLSRGLDFKKSRGQSTSLMRALGYAHALACKGLVHSDRGERELVDQLFHDALEVVRGSNHPMEASISSQHCMALLRRGDWLRSEEAARRSIAVAERSSIPFSLAISRFFHAYARFMQTQEAESLSRMRFALEWLENMEQGLYISFVYACMASAYLDSKESTLAAEFAERALRRAEQRDLLGEAAAQRVLARIYFNKGRVFLERSEAALARAFRAAELRESPREHTLTSLLEAELMVERGEHERARSTAKAAQAELARMGMSFYEQRAAQIAAATSATQPA